MVLSDSGFLDQALLKIIAEACGMWSRQSNVLIQVEHFDLFPVDARKTGQGFQKLELRSAGRGNDSRLPMFRDCVANRGSRLLGGGRGKGGLVFKELQYHNR